METSSTRRRLIKPFQAIVAGLLITVVAANVWPQLVLRLNVPLAAGIEVAFLGLFVWWARGGGPPRALLAARRRAFRRTRLTRDQWLWGLGAALLFAITIHASLVLLFRMIPFPAALFHRGYDLSFIPTVSLRWIVVAVSAASAAVCEETGFRGFMQQPMEESNGVVTAVCVSALFFAALHLNQAWAEPAMLPIVFGAGILLGVIAASAGSLLPGIIGHFVMDCGLFGYWWTGLAGNFNARPVGETGVDAQFLIASIVFVASLAGLILAIARLRKPHGSTR